jgi:hypothetical protein
VAPGRDERRHRDRDVDEEDRVPAERVDEDTAEDRPHAEGEPEHGGEGPDRPDALRLVVGRVRDDSQCHRVEHRPADGLHDARGDEPADGRRQPAEQRADGERRESGPEHAPPAEPVGRRAGEQEEAGQHEVVGVDRPLQARLRRVEVRPDVGQRHVDDRDGGDDQQHARGADREHEQAGPPVETGGRGLVTTGRRAARHGRRR